MKIYNGGITEENDNHRVAKKVSQRFIDSSCNE